MRLRETIELEFKNAWASGKQALVLEVLLDNRELLTDTRDLMAQLVQGFVEQDDAQPELKLEPKIK